MIGLVILAVSLVLAPRISTLSKRVAAYIDRVLKGATPAQLPLEQATIYELTINARTAKALGLTIPRSVLVRADQVIE